PSSDASPATTTPPAPSPTRPKPASSSAPASPSSSAAPAPSTRPTNPTNGCLSPSSKPARPSWRGWWKSYWRRPALPPPPPRRPERRVRIPRQVRLHPLGHHLRLHRPRRDHDQVDPEQHQLPPQRLRQPLHRELRRIVRPQERRAGAPAHRGDVDHPPRRALA